MENNKPAYGDMPEDYSNPPMNFYRNDNRSISLIKELSPQETLREMMEQMQGKIWDTVQNKYIKVEGSKPFMNAEGTDAFFHFATAMISSLVTMSNFTKDYKTIHAIIRYHLKKAIFHFHLHHKDYGITRKTKINMISSKLFILGLSAFYKAIGAGDRKASTSNISESINTIDRPSSQQNSEQKKSMLKRIFKI